MRQAGHCKPSVSNSKTAFFLGHDCSSGFDCCALCIALSHRSSGLYAVSVNKLMNCSHGVQWRRVFPEMQYGLNQRNLFEEIIRFSY
jgi:hypothetical protein